MKRNPFLKWKRSGEEFPNAYVKWSSEEDENLKKEFQAGKDIQELANIFHRKESAIDSRLKKLGLKT